MFDRDSVPGNVKRGIRLPWRTVIITLTAAAVLTGGWTLARQGQERDDPKPAAAAQGAAQNAANPADDSGQPDASANNPNSETDDGDVSEQKEPEYPFAHRIEVPKGILDAETEWLNASGDITIADLRGKIVVLDFWTYCCINCMHVLPDLKYLEKKYPKELVVIGVHSAKFENEKDAESIRRAVQRYEIAHPVVNDSEMRIWGRFGVRGWPTLCVIDAEGRLCYMRSGEGQRDVLDYVIGRLVKYHKATGTLDPTPVRFDLELDKLKPGPLRFPGKVLADEASGRLFVADTNHNRVVVSSLEGKLIDVIGSGTAGARDGSFTEAQFRQPHGMALVGHTLYVADTHNHLIRAVDLQARQVTTLAGTGKQDRQRGSGGKLKRTALSSPWDVTHLDGVLYIAMAGPHQLWRHELGTGRIERLAGSGREDLIDGALAEAALAQPSGITTDGQSLFFVDSEASSVRKATLGEGGEVTTLVGPVDQPRGRLFIFGDVDGVGTEARLQHPIGITWRDGRLYVADSYNHKIKTLEPTPEGWKATTLLGSGKRGSKLNPPQFSEPEGLSAAGGRLFIADTNNHRICVADLASGEVSVLPIEGLEPPSAPDTRSIQGTPSSPATKNKPTPIQPQKIAAAETLDFHVEVKLPDGYKLNKLLPVTYRLQAEEGQRLFAAEQLNTRQKATVEQGTIRIEVPLEAKTGQAQVKLALSLGYCRGGKGGLCKIHTSRWSIPLSVSPSGTKKAIKLTADTTR